MHLKMFGDSSETETNIDVDTTIKTKPPIDREEKLRKVEEKLLSNKTIKKLLIIIRGLPIMMVSCLTIIYLCHKR